MNNYSNNIANYIYNKDIIKKYGFSRKDIFNKFNLLEIDDSKSICGKKYLNDRLQYKIKNILNNIEGKMINLIIGPEGGFEEEEIQLLKSVGGQSITLGPRILRTETAGLVASAIILYELGDLGVMR